MSAREADMDFSGCFHWRFARRDRSYWSYWSFTEQSTAAVHVACPGTREERSLACGSRPGLQTMPPNPPPLRYPRVQCPRAIQREINPQPSTRLTPPWRQPRGKSMVSLVNSHTNATGIGWHLWEIDLRFSPGLPPGWVWGRSAARPDWVR